MLIVSGKRLEGKHHLQMLHWIESAYHTLCCASHCSYCDRLPLSSSHFRDATLAAPFVACGGQAQRVTGRAAKYECKSAQMSHILRQTRPLMKVRLIMSF